MKTRFLVVFALIGLIGTEAQASINGGLTKRNRVVEDLIKRDETINEKIKSLARNIDTKKVSKTIQILEDFNNKNLAYLNVSAEDIAIFNETIENIYKQKENILDKNALLILNEIKASSTKLNLIWSLKNNVEISDEELDLPAESSTDYKVVLPGFEM